MPSGSGSAVLFIAFSSMDAPGLVAWSVFRQQVIDSMGSGQSANDTVDGGPVGVWRLLASNNREVARSADLFDSFASARDSVERLQSRWQELELATFHGPASASHGWAASLDGSPAVTCARWYETGPISLDVSAASIDSFRRARITEAPVRGAGRAAGPARAAVR